MEVRSKVALSALLLCGASMATAGVNSWSTVGPEGGTVYEVRFHPTDASKLFLASSAGLYRSTNGGSSWQAIETQLFYPPVDIEIDPLDPNRLYVAGAGTTPAVVTLGNSVSVTTLPGYPSDATFQLAVASDGLALYTIDDGRVFRSKNRGQSWEEGTSLGQSVNAHNLIVAPYDSNTLYALVDVSNPMPGQSSVVFRSQDGGNSWQQSSASTYISTLLTPRWAAPGELWSARVDGVYSSADHGATWIPRSDRPAFDVVDDPAHPGTLYATLSEGVVIKSSDNGQSWVELAGKFDDENAGYRLAARPTDGLQLLAITPTGLVSSENAGASWLDRNTGLVATSAPTLSVDAAGQRVYLRAGQRAYSLGTGDESPQPLNNERLHELSIPPSPPSSPPAGFYSAASISALHAHAGVSGRIFAALPAPGQVARSLDGGSTWGAISLPSDYYSVPNGFASSAADPQLVLATSYEGLLRSADGGDHWVRVQQGLPAGAGVLSIKLAPSNATIAYMSVFVSSAGSTDWGVYKSTDGGTSWIEANSGLDTEAIVGLAVDPSDPQVAYALSFAPVRVWRTDDGGTTWHNTYTFSSPDYGVGIELDLEHPNTLYVAANNLTSRSVDRGDSWQTLDGTRLLRGTVLSLAIDPREPGTVLIGTDSRGVQRFSVQPDLSVSVNAPANVGSGELVTFSLAVLNNGQYWATGVEVSATLPSGTTGIVVPNSIPCTVNASVITCMLDKIAPQTSSSVSIAATPPAASTFAISVSAQGDQLDSNTGNNSASATTSTGAGSQRTESGGGGGISVIGLMMLISLLLARRLAATNDWTPSFRCTTEVETRRRIS